MRLRSVKALQKQCDQFNARFPVGTRVMLRKDNDDTLVTHTISEARVLSGHSAVIWVKGVAGCYLLDRVTPIADKIFGRSGTFITDEAALFAPVRITAEESARLIRAGRADGRVLHLRFGPDAVTLHPDCTWPLPLLAEWRGVAFSEGAGI